MDRFLMRRVTSIINRLVGEGKDIRLARVELTHHTFDDPVSWTGMEWTFEGGNDEFTHPELRIATDELLDIIEVGAGVLHRVDDNRLLTITTHAVTSLYSFART